MINFIVIINIIDINITLCSFITVFIILRINFIKYNIFSSNIFDNDVINFL